MTVYLSFGHEVSAEETIRTRLMMGTSVSITVESTSGRAIQATNFAFEEIRRIERVLSTYRNDSDISRLNRDGRLSYPSLELREVISRALYFGVISQGAFDITVTPLLNLYRDCYQAQKRPPNDSEIETVLALVDYRSIVANKCQIILRKQGAQVTTDAIAKGYIIDRTIQVLQENGIKRALVNIGGDSRAIGLTSQGEPWSIALQNPRESSDYLAIIPLADCAVATSGDYERYYTPDMRVHHIIDPRTGRSATSLISVTVTADTAMDADAMATTVFVLGPEKGLDLVERMRGVESLLITRNREILQSKGFQRTTNPSEQLRTQSEFIRN